MIYRLSSGETFILDLEEEFIVLIEPSTGDHIKITPDDFIDMLMGGVINLQ